MEIVTIGLNYPLKIEEEIHINNEYNRNIDINKPTSGCIFISKLKPPIPHTKVIKNVPKNSNFIFFNNIIFKNLLIFNYSHIHSYKQLNF